VEFLAESQVELAGDQALRVVASLHRTTTPSTSMSTEPCLHPAGGQRPSRVELTLNRLTALLMAQSAGTYRAFGLALLGIFSVVVILLIALGAPPISGPWDVMALLDGAWRIICGQVPHTDYHNPIGALTYLLVAFGMRVSAPSTSSISYGVALLLALVLPWAWVLTSRRLPAAIAFAFVLFFGFLLVSPRPLSYPIHETTYAMLYNREGYVFLSLLLLSLFIRPRDAGRFESSLGGLSIGLLLGLMMYCKITYFIFGAGSVFFSLLLHRRGWAMVPAALVGFAMVGAIFALLLHIDPRAYLADIAVAGQSQSLGMRLHLLSADALTDSGVTYLVMLCLIVWAWTGARNEAGELAGPRPLLIMLWIFAVALGVDSGNAAQIGAPEDPLYAAAGIIIIELYRRHSAWESGKSRTPTSVAYMTTLLLILPLVAGPIFAKDLASYSYAVIWNLKQRQEYDPSRRLHSAALRDFYVPASTTHITSYWPAREHPTNINDGIDLLRRHLQPGDRVTTIAYANPFSFALGLQPARDGPQWWDLNFSFDQKHYPSAESFLGSASLVMVPRFTDRTHGWNFDTVDLMLNRYSDYLLSHFQLVETSDHWILYRRRP
jgi:hypothetical protein